ncbi:hypothetical protein E4T42_04416 [Aureobasidium subglaciale]|nr:hypothetical protein E4T42_04416 [Aureobasidium subglaciale]
MARSSDPTLPISLFDIFLGSGRTIRRNSGPPGLPLLQTNFPGRLELVQRRSKPTSLKKSSDDSKPASAKGSNKENKLSSKKEEFKASSKKDDGKPDAKPSTPKEGSKVKAADDKKAAEAPKVSADKPQDHPEDPIFTAEEDAKILAMAAEGKKMPEIAKAIDKTKKQTGRRLGKLKTDGENAQKAALDKKAAAVDKKSNKPAEKQVTKVDNKDNETTDRKSNRLEMIFKGEVPATGVLLAGKLQHSHAHRHSVHHHIHEPEPHHHHHHAHRSHEPKATKSSRHDSAQESRSRPRKPSRQATVSVIGSTRTAYTIKTMPSLAEDDMFSFGELQALSELISKDMEGMWQRVAAAFFGMTGRRVAAEDIREKFSGLEEEG